MNFLERTEWLDEHTADRLFIRASEISDEVARDSKRDSEEYRDLDSPPMRELARMFMKREDTEYIYEWMCLQDTAFRDYVPVMVFNILKANRHD